MGGSQGGFATRACPSRGVLATGSRGVWVATTALALLHMVAAWRLEKERSAEVRLRWRRRDGLGPVAIVDQYDHKAVVGQRHHCPGRSVPVTAVRSYFALDTRYREYHYADSI
jgi:hypothetical protein